MDEVGVSDAAARLGISAGRVRALLASGHLVGRRVGSVWLVSADSLNQRLATAGASHGRPLSPRMAWSAAALLDDLPCPWLTTSERSRLRARLGRHTPADVPLYQWWLRARAAVARFRIADSDVQELLAAPRVAVGGISAADAYQLGLGHGAEAEIYVDEATLDRLVDEFFLLESAQGNLVVHVVDDQWHWRTRRVHQGQVVTPRLVVAADLLESDDTRSRSAGRQLLTTTVDNGLRGMT